MSTRAAAAEKPRREPEITFLRLVPGDSPLHRLWAGTKVLLATELMITATFAPTWITLGVVSALVLAALLIGRIPLGAFPRLPAGFYYLILLGLVLSSWSTAEPIVHVGPIPVSVGALEASTRLLLLAIVLMVSAAVVGWTTPLGAIAPALSRLGAPVPRPAPAGRRVDRRHRGRPALPAVARRRDAHAVRGAPVALAATRRRAATHAPRAGRGARHHRHRDHRVAPARARPRRRDARPGWCRRDQRQAGHPADVARRGGARRRDRDPRSR